LAGQLAVPCKRGQLKDIPNNHWQLLSLKLLKGRPRPHKGLRSPFVDKVIYLLFGFGQRHFDQVAEVRDMHTSSVRVTKFPLWVAYEGARR
jgi:hypothetical protein